MLSIKATKQLISELTEKNTTLTQRIAELEEVLTDLVNLKDIKNTSGKTPYYLLRQPLAWELARIALSQGEDK